MEVIEYMNTEEGHGGDPSYGVEHQDSYDLAAGDVILVQSGDFVKVINKSDHDQLAYITIYGFFYLCINISLFCTTLSWSFYRFLFKFIY